ncbi:hypothetical protein Vafri_8127, partial [Volvox africanus]
ISGTARNELPSVHLPMTLNGGNRQYTVADSHPAVTHWVVSDFASQQQYQVPGSVYSAPLLFPSLAPTPPPRSLLSHLAKVLVQHLHEAMDEFKNGQLVLSWGKGWGWGDGMMGSCTALPLARTWWFEASKLNITIRIQIVIEFGSKALPRRRPRQP